MAWSAPKERGPAGPGVSMSIAPPGRRTSSRAVVVWRPFPSPRTSPVASSIVPRPRRLARVDLPAPDGPRSTTVTPGSRKPPSSSMPGTADRAHGHDVAAADQPLGRLDARRERLRRCPPWSARPPGRRRSARRAPGGARAAWPEAALERADDEHLVDVRGEHLWLVGLVRARAHDGAPPREHAGDRAALKHDPVADGRSLQAGRGRGQAAGATSARSSPSSVRTVRAPRSTRATRPGTAPSRRTILERSFEGRAPAELGEVRGQLLGLGRLERPLADRWEGGRAGESDPPRRNEEDFGNESSFDGALGRSGPWLRPGRSDGLGLERAVSSWYDGEFRLSFQLTSFRSKGPTQELLPGPSPWCCHSSADIARLGSRSGGDLPSSRTLCSSRGTPGDLQSPRRPTVQPGASQERARGAFARTSDSGLLRFLRDTRASQQRTGHGNSRS